MSFSINIVVNKILRIFKQEIHIILQKVKST